MTSDSAAPGGPLKGINAHETAYLYEEIFTHRCYHPPGMELPKNAIVLDVGANIGMYSLFVISVYPTATVHAFEPVPPIFDALSRNLAPHGAIATAYPYGLSDRDAEAEFVFYPGYSTMSAQRAHADAAVDRAFVKDHVLADRGGELGDAVDFLDEMLEYQFREATHRSEVRRLSTVIDELRLPRIDMLKIDVQRAEVEVLRGISDRHWPLVHRIAVEVHDEPGTATEGRLPVVVAELARRGLHVGVAPSQRADEADRHTVLATRLRP